jgi:hypothetical protein
MALGEDPTDELSAPPRLLSVPSIQAVISTE